MGKFNLGKSRQSSVLKHSFGFTLIELIVVIGVMAIISTIGLAALDPMTQFQKSSDARKKSDLAQIQKALEIYYEDSGMYPEYVVGFKIRNNDSNQSTVEWGTSWQPYMNVLPKSPDSTNYIYYSPAGGQSYYLYASLSRGDKDQQACNDGLTCQSIIDLDGVIPENACDPGGAGLCNYGVSSANVSP